MEKSMPLTRRNLLIALSFSPFFPYRAFAAIPDWDTLAIADTMPPKIPAELDFFSDQPSLNEGVISSTAPTGTLKPTDEEVSLANEVLSRLPQNCTPVEIALYFLSVGQGQYGSEKISYITAWPERWNPVIVEFFKATKTQPYGDTTAWCAAFMNYCLLKSAIGKQLPSQASKPTHSASALSFSDWGEETSSPRPGDIVVFENITKPSGRGHVGFFIADKGDSVLVLGGNQYEGKPVRHTINRKLIKKDGSILKLRSYRTEAQLHV
jgi:uncharacterized protein (TIGR02594 family)